MTEAVPPGIAPPAYAPLAAGAEIRAHLANPEKSGDAKLRDWDAVLAASQGRYVRRTASKAGETLRRKGKGPSSSSKRYGACNDEMAARPPDTLHPILAKKGR